MLLNCSCAMLANFEDFWATIRKTVRRMLSDRCPVCDVGVLCPNGCMDQDETWHAGRPRPWPHCVRWGPSSPSPKGEQPPIFGLYLLWSNGCMDQDATWYEGRPRPMRLGVRWGPHSPYPKGGKAPPNHGPMFIVAKLLGGSRWYLAWRYASAQVTLC